MGYIYMITNTVNGKAYIGISVHEPETGRIKDHLSGNGNRAIANAVKKYGRDAFTYELLEENVFPTLLPDLEVAYIKQFNTVAPNGYNLTTGGEGEMPSEETRQKMSESSKRRYEKYPPPMLGKTHSKETNLRISENLKNNPLAHEAQIKATEAAAIANKGKNRPKEVCEKMRQANLGKTHSKETCEKMSLMRQSPEYKEAYQLFKELPNDMDINEKKIIIRSNFSNKVKGVTISNWLHRWVRKLYPSSNNTGFYRTLEYPKVKELYDSIPADIPLKEKHDIIFKQFPKLSKNTIYRWTRQWRAEPS